MGLILLYSVIIWAGISKSATADTTNNVTVICTDGWGCPMYDPFELPVWDDRVFNVGAKASSPSLRPKADELGYDSAQRAVWIEECRLKLRIDFHAFQQCFRAEQGKAADEVRRQFEGVERRQSWRR